MQCRPSFARVKPGSHLETTQTPLSQPISAAWGMTVQSWLETAGARASGDEKNASIGGKSQATRKPDAP